MGSSQFVVESVCPDCNTTSAWLWENGNDNIRITSPAQFDVNSATIETRPSLDKLLSTWLVSMFASAIYGEIFSKDKDCPLNAQSLLTATSSWWEKTQLIDPALCQRRPVRKLCAWNWGCKFYWAVPPIQTAKRNWMTDAIFDSWWASVSWSIRASTVIGVGILPKIIRRGLHAWMHSYLDHFLNRTFVGFFRGVANVRRARRTSCTFEDSNVVYIKSYIAGNFWQQNRECLSRWSEP